MASDAPWGKRPHRHSRAPPPTTARDAPTLPKPHTAFAPVASSSSTATMDAAAPPSPASEVRDGLCKALDSIKAAGSFAAFREISETSVAPIFVHDVGLVGFPLQKSMTRALIEKARQAPYGKGNETFVDTSVRNTWELDAAQLDLGPQWAPAIDDACKWVAQQLGITAPVTAELYKMLIYEEGALFKAHTE